MATSIQPFGGVHAYRTRDGSEIRELMHPAVHGNVAQSLAEARVPPGARTLLHRHHRSEELYHILSGGAHGAGRFELRRERGRHGLHSARNPLIASR